jgi:hypothetical protein
MMQPSGQRYSCIGSAMHVKRMSLPVSHLRMAFDIESGPFATIPRTA